MQIVRRSRLGNNTEDVTLFSSQLTRTGSVAVIDGYDVLNLQTIPPLNPPVETTPAPGPPSGAVQAAGAQAALGPIDRPAPKLFDVLGLEIKTSPNGIAYVPSKNQFVFNDDQATRLFFADARGAAPGTIDIQYPRGAPDGVEGLTYIPPNARNFPDSLAMVAIFADDNSPSRIQSRVEIINLNGRVVREIVPQGGLANVFLTGLCFKTDKLTESLLISSDDDNNIYELDFKGQQLSQFSPPVKQTGFIGIEGLVQIPAGELAAANGFAGLLEVFSLNEVPLPQAVDYRIGLGLSLPAGLAWDSTTNEFLILALDRLRPNERFVARLQSSLASFRLAINSDVFARKVTYIPEDRLIAVAHATNPRGIQLFTEQGQLDSVIDTSKLRTSPPVILSYLPESREFGIVFRDDPRNQLARLKRDGSGFNTPIDFAPAGIQKITAITFFKPSSATTGQFLVFDNTQDLFVVTDFTGAKLSQTFSIRETLRVLNPTAVTAITTGPDAGAFAICNSENSEVVVFRLN